MTTWESTVTPPIPLCHPLPLQGGVANTDLLVHDASTSGQHAMSRELSVETTRLHASLFSRLSHCRGSQCDLGPTVRLQSSHMRLASEF
ncbi:hypothetical protein TNCV_3757341 [Trichonephila clavipes]|nr:hypothetical protein TNCV_3757341 [Trichonephila clavipes]